MMEANEAMARTTTYTADELIKQLRMAADVFHPAGQAADELTALRERVAELEGAAQFVVDCLTPDATKLGHLRTILAKQGGGDNG